MATQGVPFKKSKLEIIESIKKHRGRLTKVAKDLGCHYQTVRKYTDDDPTIVELIQNLRQDREEGLLDEAEDTLEEAMTGRSEDMSSALKSAFFVLNNKGKARGYTPPNTTQEQEVNKFTPSQITEYIDLRNDK